MGALLDRVLDQRVGAGCRPLVDQRAQRCVAGARISGGQRLRLLGELAGETVGNGVVNDDALRRHADLAGVHERAEGSGTHRVLDVGVLKDNERRLAAEFEQHRLEIARRYLGDDAADARRAREVDAAHRRMRDHCLDDLAGIGGIVGEHVEHAGGRPASRITLAKHVLRAGAQLGGFQARRCCRRRARWQRSGTARMIGAFHGAIDSTTPAGRRTAIEKCPACRRE